jgi:hypothetical protein
MPPAAVTPASTFETVIQGIYIKWGKISQTGKSRDIVYPVLFSSLGLHPFPNACLHVFWQICNPNGDKWADAYIQDGGSTSTTLKPMYQGQDGDYVPAGDTSFLAIGY